MFGQVATSAKNGIKLMSDLQQMEKENLWNPKLYPNTCNKYIFFLFKCHTEKDSGL